MADKSRKSTAVLGLVSQVESFNKALEKSEMWAKKHKEETKKECKSVSTVSVKGPRNGLAPFVVEAVEERIQETRLAEERIKNALDKKRKRMEESKNILDPSWRNDKYFTDVIGTKSPYFNMTDFLLNKRSMSVESSNKGTEESKLKVMKVKRRKKDKKHKQDKHEGSHTHKHKKKKKSLRQEQN
eukprot:Platyproteum_vivax@DN6562_c0_g1_i2.p1